MLSAAHCEVKNNDLKVVQLVQSSPNAMLVDNMNATKSGDEATRGFKPSGNPMPLAVRLNGKFKTAFPDGLNMKRTSRSPARRRCANRPTTR